MIGKVLIRTYVTKDAINKKKNTSEGQQKEDIRCKIGFLGIEIDYDSRTVVFKVGGFFLSQDASYSVSSFQTHKFASS